MSGILVALDQRSGKNKAMDNAENPLWMHKTYVPSSYIEHYQLSSFQPKKDRPFEQEMDTKSPNEWNTKAR